MATESDSQKKASPFATFDLAPEEIESIVNELGTGGLIAEGKLDLGKFNSNIKTASENLNYIIPSIVAVSKGQVMIVNEGLENVVNFIRAFQTVNTTFALVAANPTDGNKISHLFEDIDEMQTLETTIIKKVKSSLENLGKDLKDSISESVIYYSALAQIIYSESEEGVIELPQFEDSEIKQKLMASMPEEFKSGTRLKKGLGLVQLIKSLDDLTKGVSKISEKIGDKIGIDYIPIKAKGTDNEIHEIRLKVDILESLKSMSKELISALNKAGLLFAVQTNQVKQIKADQYGQWVFSQYGVESVKTLVNSIDETSEIINYFKEKVAKAVGIANYKAGDTSVSGKFLLEKYAAMESTDKAAEEANKLHNEIVKKQAEFIDKVVQAFAKIVAAWGDSVDNEIQIGQVAGKSVDVLRKLSEVELKVDKSLNQDALLITIDAQRSITKTCDTAKDLKNLGQVMRFLLDRVKSLLAFNKGMHLDITKYTEKVGETKEFQKAQKEKSRKALYKTYADKIKSISVVFNGFTETMIKLSELARKSDNLHFFERFVDNYKQVKESMNSLKQLINKSTENVNATNFSESCKELNIGDQISLDKVAKKLHLLFEDFKSLRETFRADFEEYKVLSVHYKSFIDQIQPLLGVLDYVVGIDKDLADKELDYKLLNASIYAFKDVFEDIKKSQNEQVKIDQQLMKLMEQLGMNRLDTYKKYKEDLFGTETKLSKLFDELELFVKQGLEEQGRLKDAYSQVKQWVKTFEVDFKRYETDLNEAKVNFFSKLFNADNYKKTAFWERLNDIEKSLINYDDKINQLEHLELSEIKPGNEVKGFCDNSIEFVKKLLNGYSSVVNEMYSIASIMALFLGNIKTLLDEGFIKEFKDTFELIDKANNKLSEIKKKTGAEMDEFENVSTSQIMPILDKLKPLMSNEKEGKETKWNFYSISERAKMQEQLLLRYKDEIAKDVDEVRGLLIKFFVYYLKKVLPKEEADKYEALYRIYWEKTGPAFVAKETKASKKK
ncbi:Uncharacterised protein [Candidatus Tiddalikarchaeum anstoanum]|nr:Uncharacterised protein [Candidatus Tiddalikarchaeum anstoanum]